ncbi:hypothetical protein ABDK00_001670 [Niabella insulamsoli]|uniref:hypothetical protein n=1 Tax=Niabella insulamsoli TaxID=3144874 RepID=UPI0031FD64AC
MPLNAEILGLALYNKAKLWNDKDIKKEDLDRARKEFWQAVANEIINHFIANIKLTIPGTGLVAPSGGGAVTGNSVLGKIQ